MIEGLAPAHWVEEVVVDYYDKCAVILKELIGPNLICRSDMFHIFRLCVEEVASTHPSIGMTNEGTTIERVKEE